MTMILNEIVKYKKVFVKEQKFKVPLKKFISQIQDLHETLNFKQAIKKTTKINLIAEIKKASPSKGIIRKDFNPEKIAKIYQQNGTSAISILTDEKFFQGSIEYLKSIRKVVNIPILRKEFIIDEYQIYESRIAGADAILLIVSILDKYQLQDFKELCSELNLSILLEVYNKKELDIALEFDFPIIGINNRNLQTFEVDINNTIELIKFIPRDKIKVSESGISNYEQVKLLDENNIDAILVGETLMREKDIAKAIKNLMNKI